MPSHEMSPGSVTIQCPECARNLMLRMEQVDRLVQCPGCQRIFPAVRSSDLPFSEAASRPNPTVAENLADLDYDEPKIPHNLEFLTAGEVATQVKTQLLEAFFSLVLIILPVLSHLLALHFLKKAKYELKTLKRSRGLRFVFLWMAIRLTQVCCLVSLILSTIILVALLRETIR
jgi:hypothetical protein